MTIKLYNFTYILIYFYNLYYLYICFYALYYKKFFAHLYKLNMRFIYMV